LFDAHMHIDSVEPLGWDLPVEDCIAAMDESEIEKAVVMSITDAPAVNETALEDLAAACARYPGRLYPLARIHPWYSKQAEELLERALGELGFRGLKLHPVTTLTHPASDQTLRLIEVAAAHGVPTLFHSGDEPLATPLAVAEAARSRPEATVILGHMGGYFHVDEALAVAERFDNVVLETSAMPYPSKVAEAVGRVGAGRVMFGSDGPACPPRLELEKIRLAELEPDAFQRVTNDNAIELFEGGG
jgi:predicted TIM-barrel fold metal-dependent hydrolase